MTITADKARWYEDSEGFWLAVRTKDRAAASSVTPQVTDGWEVTLGRQKKRRSLDANAYCWVLLDKLAAVLKTTKEELYRLYVKRVGIFRDFHLDPEESKSFEVAWSRLGTGWITEQVDFTQDGEQVVIRAYYGSSQYNTKQMSRLIDEIVEDCKKQGIETMTPCELEVLIGRWEGQ